MTTYVIRRLDDAKFLTFAWRRNPYTDDLQRAELFGAREVVAACPEGHVIVAVSSHGWRDDYRLFVLDEREHVPQSLQSVTALCRVVEDDSYFKGLVRRFRNYPKQAR